MLDIFSKTVSSIFGNKSGRDLKTLWPKVELINNEYKKLQGLSHDQLRNKTKEFRQIITERLKTIDAKTGELNEKIENNPEMEPEDKEDIFFEIEKLQKDRNKELEKILNELLPQAFAVVKETARRFKENEHLEVIANDRDRELATDQDFVDLEGDKAIYHNSWDAAGVPVKWDMLHYDVQLIGGIVLHDGKISEMATGEGKTLVSTLPAYLNALPQRGVHIVTVNDYLARRDCEWNGPLYEFLGVTVDCIEYYEPNSTERKQAYMADITYGTNNEFGFDYLRDNMAHTVDDIVQRPHHYAMVDEVDSVLIDDARTPLIISGPTPKGDIHEFFELKPRVENLMNAQKSYINKALNRAKDILKKGDKLSKEEDKEAGLLMMRAHRGLPKNKALIKFLSEPGIKAFLQKSENYYLQDNQKQMPEVDKELFFVIDEKNQSTELTEKGVELITTTGEDPDFFIMPDVGGKIADIEKSSLSSMEKLEAKDVLMQDFALKSERIHTINQLLKAYALFELDTEYIIAEGKIKIVDEQTGRVLEGRRYSDGLHQAIEAKENVKVEAATQTYATITLQNYFRMYHKLCGMTGTAETEAGEFWQIYKLDVVVIPTNKPIVRKDSEDYVYKTVREKYNAVIERISKLVNDGRPVLVGTTSVEISELLSRMLKLRGIRHNVLNAKQHQREAEIVAEAGQAGTVTIATNMAGRGTDIKLGPGVREAGGLAIVGTERHESRRVDRQLRGRSGRQGDPGSTEFFVSLEDNLMRLFGSERIAKYMDRLGLKEGEVIQHSLITKSIERAQKKVEQNNFGTRKRLLEYDDVMNSQREVIYKRRKNALYGERLQVDLKNMLRDLSDEFVNEFYATNDYEGLQLELLRVVASDVPFTQEEFTNGKPDALGEQLFVYLEEHYKRKMGNIADKSFPIIKNIYEDKGDQIESIVVPFTDGIKNIHVQTDLKKAYQTNGKEITKSFEKVLTLALIDDDWKEHLRELDDLRQSVGNAYLEQKDPLLIYKLESFKLFQTMLGKINREVLSTLFKGNIQSNEPEPLKEGRTPLKNENKQLKTSRNDIYNSANEGGGGPPQETEFERQAAKPDPVRVGEKIGRNDPCPCGSGKKYKNCHGKNDL